MRAPGDHRAVGSDRGAGAIGATAGYAMAQAALAAPDELGAFEEAMAEAPPPADEGGIVIVARSRWRQTVWTVPPPTRNP